MILYIFFMKCVGVIFLSLALCMFLACAPKVIYKEVFIPVKCEVTPPKKPVFNPAHNALSENLSNIFIYVELLEKDLYFCTKTP